ncbi:hypothetical protein AAZX31_01G101400 [Glycine max]
MLMLVICKDNYMQVISTCTRNLWFLLGKRASTIICMCEDNVACIVQLKKGYIKEDRTKHILPKFFFIHDLQKNGDINVQQVRLRENLSYHQVRLLSYLLTRLNFVILKMII